MKTIQKYSFAFALFLFALLATTVAVTSYPSQSLATKSNFYWKKSNYSATTTDAYMTPGTGTTTVSLDSYVNGTNQTVDSAVLTAIYTASSSLGIVKFNYEYSQNGIDWYEDNLNLPYATTTPLITGIGVQMPNVFTWGFASSTLGTSKGQASVIGGYTNKIFSVPTPTRFVRVNAYVPIGAANGRIHLELIAKGQQY